MTDRFILLHAGLLTLLDSPMLMRQFGVSPESFNRRLFSPISARFPLTSTVLDLRVSR